MDLTLHCEDTYRFSFSERHYIPQFPCEAARSHSSPSIRKDGGLRQL